ncbi:MAG TPA: hypothetical protein VME01_10160 [Solirubrobacteraceae bacterium]|nr:hypothetical protein [Solirubrobacteraceae bacterium]
MFARLQLTSATPRPRRRTGTRLHTWPALRVWALNQSHRSARIATRVGDHRAAQLRRYRNR